MSVKRVRTVKEPQATVVLEGGLDEVLPSEDVSYYAPKKSSFLDNKNGNTLRDIDGDVIELPRTTWY